MRFIRFIAALGCLLIGAVVGALNRELVTVDFGLGSIATNLGVALIVALLLGVLAGGMAISASLVLPLRRRLARADRERKPQPRSGE